MDEHGAVLSELSIKELDQLINKILFINRGPASAVGVITTCDCDAFRDNPYVGDTHRYVFLNFYSFNYATSEKIKHTGSEDGVHHIINNPGAIANYRAYPVSSLSQEIQERINKEYAAYLMTKIIET